MCVCHGVITFAECSMQALLVNQIVVALEQVKALTGNGGRDGGGAIPEEFCDRLLRQSCMAMQLNFKGRSTKTGTISITFVVTVTYCVRFVLMIDIGISLNLVFLSQFTVPQTYFIEVVGYFISE